MPTLERSGSRVHYWLTAGHESGPLVVFTHGASMDHRMFDAQVKTVTGAGYRALTWDIRGHGESKPLGRTPVSIRDMGDDLLAILDEEGERHPVVLVGQSLGGYVSQQLVRDHPERVAALVVIGATSRTWPLGRWEEWLLRISPWWFRLMPNALRHWGIGVGTAVTPEIRAYARAAAGQLSKREFVEVWQAVANSIDPDPEFRVPCPFLLTHGDADRTGNVARTALGWASREPHCRYAVIPRAGHNANQDNADQFDAILLDFLTEHVPR